MAAVVVGGIKASVSTFLHVTSAVSESEWAFGG